MNFQGHKSICVYTGTTIKATLRPCVKAFGCPASPHPWEMPSLIRQELPSLSSLQAGPTFSDASPLARILVCIQAPCLSCSSMPASAPPAHVPGERTPCSCEMVPCRKMLSNLLGRLSAGSPRAFPKPPQAAAASLACEVLAARITHSLARGRSQLWGTGPGVASRLLGTRAELRAGWQLHRPHPGVGTGC